MVDEWGFYKGGGLGRGGGSSWWRSLMLVAGGRKMRVAGKVRGLVQENEGGLTQNQGVETEGGGW